MYIKRMICGLLAASVMMSSTALAASADSGVRIHMPQSPEASRVEGKVKFGSVFSYRVNPDGKTVSLIEFSSKAISNGTLRLPKKLDGMEVTVLAEELNNCFYDFYPSIKTVDFSKTITTIEDGAIPDWVDGDMSAPVFLPDLFTIKCYNKSAAENYAIEMGFKYKIKNAPKNYVPTVRFKKSCAVGKTAVKIKWCKLSGVSGYRVYRYNDNKWNKLADLPAGTAEYKDTQCSRKGENLYTVRAFRKSGKKTYWSKKCTVKYIGCMSSAAPKIQKLSSKKASGGSSFNKIEVTVANNGISGCGIVVEVQDPESKQWSEPAYFDQEEKGSTVISLEDYWLLLDGRSYCDHFNKGSSYNMRIRYCRMIGDSGYWRDEQLYTAMFHYVYSKPVENPVKI